MRKKIFTLVLLVFLVSGCASGLRFLDLGTKGYDTPEGAATRTAITTAATPLVGEPISVIVGGIISMIIGGLAVWKRQRWLDTPPKQ